MKERKIFSKTSLLLPTSLRSMSPFSVRISLLDKGCFTSNMKIKLIFRESFVIHSNLNIILTFTLIYIFTWSSTQNQVINSIILAIAFFERLACYFFFFFLQQAIIHFTALLFSFTSRKLFITHQYMCSHCYFYFLTQLLPSCLCFGFMYQVISMYPVKIYANIIRICASKTWCFFPTVALGDSTKI